MTPQVIRKYYRMLALVGLSMTSLLFATDTKDDTYSFLILFSKNLGFSKYAVKTETIDNKAYDVVKIETKKSENNYGAIRRRLDGWLYPFDLGLYDIQKKSVLGSNYDAYPTKYTLLKPKENPKQVAVNVLLHNGNRVLDTMKIKCYKSNKCTILASASLYSYEKEVKKSRFKENYSIEFKLKASSDFHKLDDTRKKLQEALPSFEKIEYIKVNVAALQSDEAFWSKFRSSKFSRYTWRSTFGRVVMVVGAIVFVGYQYLVSTAEPAESEV